MKKTTILKAILAIASIYTADALNAQTYNFTNCGATGSNGPTQTDVTNTYTATTLAGSVNINTQGIQEWTVPASGTYKLTAIGACGGEFTGSSNPGLPGSGATTTGAFSLDSGTIINVVVGQMGLFGSNGTGGGGGSFIYTDTIGGAGLLMAAGGGGGTGHGSSSVPNPFGGGGSDTTTTVDGINGNGNGGSQGIGHGGFKGSYTTASHGQAAGGAGWLSSGEDMMDHGYSATGGNQATMQGGVSGTSAHGGFGGGGATSGNGSAGGGGGGYTGGGGGNEWTGQVWGAGAGAGSYNSALNAQNTAGITGFSGTFFQGSVEIEHCEIQVNQNLFADETADCSINSLTTPTATSDCGYSVTATNDAIFPIETEGTTVVTWTFTDEIGSEIKRKQNVIINNNIDNGITMLDNVLTATQAGATYQWVDCNNNNVGISGETNQNFTATKTGDYAVIVSLGGACVSTSTCVSYINPETVGIDNIVFESLKVYPNPTSNIVNINISENLSSIRIMDLTGNTIKVFNAEAKQLDITELNSGIYFLEIANAEKKSVVKIIKR